MMGGKKNGEDRTVDLLRSYGAELSDERSGLEYVIISPPDGQGGHAERDRDRAFRRCLTHPADVTAADACIEALTRFKERQSSFDDVQVELCLIGQTGLADALARRRTRREADVDRMIGAAENLKDAIRKSDAQADEFADEVGVPYDVAKALKDALNEQPTFGVPSGSQCDKPTEPSVIDYRQWEDAAARFNRGIADDVGFIGKIVARPNALKQAQLDRIEVAATRAANGIEGLTEELSTWREWVQKLATEKEGNTTAPKLCAPIQKKIVELWQTFTDEAADCEDRTEPDGWRKHKRTYDECLIVHGNDDVWHGKKLKELIPDAKSFERVIHNANEKQRQKRAKRTAASTPQARRKK